MASELQFTCGLAHGLHARPASQLADALVPFEAHVTLTHLATGKTADMRSVLSVVALDVALGDTCLITATGRDAEAAIAAMRAAVDAASDEDEAGAGGAEDDDKFVPAGLRRLNAKWTAGTPISPGTARGPVFIVRSLKSKIEEHTKREPAAELADAHRALAEVHEAISARLELTNSQLERDLLRAHLNIAGDPALRKAIEKAIEQGDSARAAITHAGQSFMDALKASTSEYIRERAIDVADVCEQALERLVPGGATTSNVTLERDAVIVADMLTPRQMMQLDRMRTKALVLGGVGATSHTAILARALGVPAMVDVHDIDATFLDGGNVIVDADAGFVLHDVTPEIARYYEIGERSAAQRRAKLSPFATKRGITRCGMNLEVGANVATPDEVAIARANGADGVGLFRTEMLFLDRLAPPTEEEQFEAYTTALKHANGSTIIFRTLDIGGDKPAPYLRLPAEENPFLGFRGIRLYEKFSELLRSQLRALLRASAHGPMKLMAPMVTHAAEAAWFRARVAEVQNELKSEGAAFDDALPIGVMIEVPSAALAVTQMAEHVDFFSIGTNDLTQYFTAADRGNARVASLCDPLEPAFLRLLKTIVDDAKAANRWVGVCGEMAGDELHLPIMIGLGLDEISVSSGRVLELKARMSAMEGGDCHALFTRTLTMRNAGEVRAALRSMTTGEAEPIIDTDLIVVGSDARSKVEAIKELVGVIATAGRVADANALEHAVWEREDTYSTGLGFGFAIPHAKSDAVRVPTVAVARLANPIEWGSTDGKPVEVAIMLAIPGSVEDAGRMHMQVLAKLARKLMHEEFRAAILAAKKPSDVMDALKATVGA